MIMKISLIYVGKDDDKFAGEAVKMFEKRIKHYLPFEVTASGKIHSGGLPPEIQRETEGRLLLKFIENADLPVLLDVKGKQFSSVAFSEYIQFAMNRGTRHLGFIIGGPYGFSEEVYRNVPERISLSSFTFSHQLVRLIFWNSSTGL